MTSDVSAAVDWPAELIGVFERAITCEYASLTGAGAPVTVPSTPYLAAQTIDVSTGLTYPAKAERARRDGQSALSRTPGRAAAVLKSKAS